MYIYIYVPIVASGMLRRAHNFSTARRKVKRKALIERRSRCGTRESKGGAILRRRGEKNASSLGLQMSKPRVI
jgi:hypothetical protein